MKPSLEVVIVSGLSGSGKSTAIDVLEDLGYYCIDNLPVVLIPRFLDLCRDSLESIDRVGLGIDIRAREFFSDYPRVFEKLHHAGYRFEVLFLEATDDVLVRRFSETRRPHPLGESSGPTVGIQREREELRGLRERANRVLDTSALTVHQLRDELRRIYRGSRAADGLTVLLVSFGYKFGIPTDADIVLDVRFLTNPFFVDALRGKSGCDPEVADFVLERAEARDFLRLAEALLEYTLPLYQRDGRSYLTIALGCTGGRHRSVAVAECLRQVLAPRGYGIQVQHRDMQR